MFGKFIVVFCLALCATQGLPANNIPESLSLSSIIQDIKDLIATVEAIIRDLPGFIANLITDLRNKIQDAIASIDIAGIINSIEDKIEAILNSAGIDVSVARHCIDAEKASVVELLEGVSQRVEKCRQDAEESTKKLEEKLNSLATNALSLVKEITSGTAQCFLDHPLNPIKQTACLTGLMVEMTQRAAALTVEVAETMLVATKTAAEISLNVVSCTARINADIVKGQIQIIENFQTCVEEINQ